MENKSLPCREKYINSSAFSVRMAPNNKATKTPAPEAKNQPIGKFRQGAFSVAVWENEGKNGTFLTANIQRGYKKGDEWVHENISVAFNDLPRLAAVLNQAYAMAGKVEQPLERGEGE